MTVLGLGPHGETAAPPERVSLLPQDIAQARERNFRVGIVVHTLQSDWATRLVRGMIGTLGECGALVIDVADCGFSAETQAHALDRLRRQEPDAIISLPVANADVAEAHRRVSEDGIHLTLIDNAPTGLTPGRHYGSLVSADNYGLGQMAAQLLSPHVGERARIGLIGYDTEFFPTDQREIAFSAWLDRHRPDVTVDIRRFSAFADVRRLTGELIDRAPELAGLFVIWDGPCHSALAELRHRNLRVPVTTIDLGKQVTEQLARDQNVVGIAAQRPFQQGEVVARATLTHLLGRSCPSWIVLPGIAVDRDSVVQAYQTIWREVVPRSILEGLSILKP
ncbi:substrate-binding domain-containing protein [Pseudoroseicyclus sp. CXY001]|uniref:substrate-binding domain-containing protein n=1 Tax=Pseudoroseicyclus sp. CXY001 TaxID=3242492 RepID=UPI00358DA8E9